MAAMRYHSRSDRWSRLILPIFCISTLFWFLRFDHSDWSKLSMRSADSQPDLDGLVSEALLNETRLDLAARNVHFEAHARLWAAVPFPNRDEQDPSRSTWAYVHDVNSAASLRKQRASWGGLLQQGAKAHIKDALRKDKRYLFSEGVWGWNNQVLEIINLIYLGHLTGRIPITFDFSANDGHFSGVDRSFRLPVSTVFDLSALAGVLDLPIVESREVKHASDLPDWQLSAVYDGETSLLDAGLEPLPLGSLVLPEPPAEDLLGCYSYNMVQYRSESKFDSMKNIHFSLLSLPPRICREGNCERASIFEVAKFIDQDPEVSLAEHISHGHKKPSVLPDPQLACIDHIYFLMTQPDRFKIIPDEVEAGYGMWAVVGKHMRFQPGLMDLAQQYLRHQMGLNSRAEVPPYLAVHIRRTDMIRHLPVWANKPAVEWLYAAWLLLQEIREHNGIIITKVVLTTDEEDPTWLAPLINAGWYLMDHTATDTARRLGSEWFPVLLDSVILSGGHGFLGMKDSTMSGLAYRRVIDWQRGLGRFAKVSQPIPDGWRWDWPLE